MPAAEEGEACQACMLRGFSRKWDSSICYLTLFSPGAFPSLIFLSLPERRTLTCGYDLEMAVRMWPSLPAPPLVHPPGKERLLSPWVAAGGRMGAPHQRKQRRLEPNGSLSPSLPLSFFFHLGSWAMEET